MQSPPDGLSVAQGAQRGAALAAYMRDVAAMDRVHRLVQRRTGRHRDSYVARELVIDVAEDMLEGVLPFDPALPTQEQVEAYVKRRATRLRNADRPASGARRVTLVPIDEAPSSALVIAGPDEVLDENAITVDPVEWVRRTRERAIGDEPVERLLALFDLGLYLRRDALDADMTDWSFRTARRRLREYASSIRDAMVAEAVAEQLAT